MKQGHLSLLFLVIYLICVCSLSVEQKKYDRAFEEKRRVEQALLEALEMAGGDFAAVINAPVKEKQRIFEQSFLEALYISLGLVEDTEAREQLEVYLPLLILVEEDGAFFSYIEEVEKKEMTELHRVWSEKKLFLFPQECVDAQKKAMMAQTLEDSASEYITNHNDIASQFGVSYSFNAPSFMQNMEETLEFPILLVVFQGWPLTAAGDIFYENCLDTGGYLQKTERYIVELPKDVKNTESVYHKACCPLIKEGDGRYEENYYTMQEALMLYGSYPCKICCP